MSNCFGYHAMLDCANCDVSRFTKENITNFTKDLVKQIGMTAYGEPIIEHFANHNPDVGGFTMVQLIETSDITAHFVDANGSAFFDCFSCKVFPVNVFRNVVEMYFAPKAISQFYLERFAPSLPPSPRKRG